ncbi:lytic transglycosylase domain-containing protein [Cupriavidus gilardii]|nr:lytic transglycosylase domain-containing protein [Cupriavidus gilardii]
MMRLFAIAAVAALSTATHAEDLTKLMAACAPQVHPSTLSAIVRTESNGRMYVLSDDGPRGLPYAQRKTMLRTIHAGSSEEAATIAKDLIARGHLVGLGLTQVNSQNLPALGLTVEQVLDPCINLRAGGQILTSFFRTASVRLKDPQEALLAAISAYNTGSFQRGFANGYVRKVLVNAGAGVPALSAASRRGLQAKGRTMQVQYLQDARHSEIEVEFQ